MKRREVATIGAIVTLLGAAAYSLFNPDPRQKVVKAALSQVGEQDPDKYWQVTHRTLFVLSSGRVPMQYLPSDFEESPVFLRQEISHKCTSSNNAVLC